MKELVWNGIALFGGIFVWVLLMKITFRTYFLERKRYDEKEDNK
jgi:hypothetical protein